MQIAHITKSKQHGGEAAFQSLEEGSRVFYLRTHGQPTQESAVPSQLLPRLHQQIRSHQAKARKYGVRLPRMFGDRQHSRGRQVRWFPDFVLPQPPRRYSGSRRWDSRAANMQQLRRKCSRRFLLLRMQNLFMLSLSRRPQSHESQPIASPDPPQQFGSRRCGGADTKACYVRKIKPQTRAARILLPRLPSVHL